MKNKAITIILLIFEVMIVFSYASAFIPFLYLIVGFTLVPVTLANMVIALAFNSKTKGFAIINFLISILGFIPFLGYPLRIIGFVLALLSAIKLGEKLK